MTSVLKMKVVVSVDVDSSGSRLAKYKYKVIFNFKGIKHDGVLLQGITARFDYVKTKSKILGAINRIVNPSLFDIYIDQSFINVFNNSPIIEMFKHH